MISFRRPFSEYTVAPFPLVSTNIIIAPFWEDINIHNAGEIYFRSSNDTSLLREVGALIGDGSEFLPDTLFIATWDRVAPIGSPGEAVNIILHRKWFSYQGLTSES